MHESPPHHSVCHSTARDACCAPMFTDISHSDLGLLFRVAADPRRDAAHRDPGWTLGHPGLLLFGPRHTRDVEMDPGRVIYKFLENHCRRNRSTIAASTRVHDVGNAGLDHL